MVQPAPASDSECASRYFFAADSYVMMAGNASLNTDTMEGANNEGKIVLWSHAVLVADKAEINISKIMVDCAAAALSANERNIVAPYVLVINLLPRVLIAPDDDCRLRAPHQRNWRMARCCKVMLQGQVSVWRERCGI